MIENQYHIDLIDKFLLENLSEDESVVFNDLLEHNIEFRKELEFQKNLIIAVQETDILAFREDIINIRRQMLDDENNTVQSSTKSVGLLNYKRFLYAAIITFFVTASAILIYVLMRNNISNDELFAEYYQSYPANFLSRTTDSLSSIGDAAFMAYEKKDFRIASRLFEKAMNLDSSNSKLVFYLSLTYIEIKDYDKALLYLKKLYANKDRVYFEQSRWYFALCLLKTNAQPEMYIPILKEISESGSYKAIEAKGILNSLAN